jgi:cardiolipin synthase
VDGKWARVGSTNLNLQSWLGNYELDVAIEHDGVAQELEAHYLEDLGNATEIVLSHRARVQPIAPAANRQWLRRGGMGGSGRAAASAIRVANSLGTAITNRRVLGPAESRLMVNIGVGLAAISALGLVFPRLLAVPLSIVAGWLGLAAFIKAIRLRQSRASSEVATTTPSATVQVVERLP